MPSRLHARRPATVRLALAAASALVLAACGEGGPASAEASGGPGEQARGLLASERPWQASRVLDDTAPTSGEDRVLAARAAAGWGNWARVEELLGGLDQPGSYAEGLGLYLLARARDERGDAEGAAAGYRTFLEIAPTASGLDTERDAARLRLALNRVAAGEDADSLLETVAASLATAEPWLDVLRARALAHRGDTAAVRAIREGVSERILELWARRAHVEAARTAGDVALARELANDARGWARSDGTDAEFMLAAGAAALAMGDTAAARDAFRATVELEAASPHARDAADHLLADSTAMSAADHLAVARVHVARGLHEDALPHFEAWLEARPSSGERARDVGYEYADALFYALRPEDALEYLETLPADDGVRRLRARTLGLLGETEESSALYRELASDGGTLDLFLAADVWHEAGEYDRARPIYRELIRRYPGRDRAGLAMMRLAGMAFEEEDWDEAGRIWEEYRSRYPRGSRALQSTYWLGRVRQEQGNDDAARALFREVLEEERDSYYALLASRRLDEPFWPLPMSPSPTTTADQEARVVEWTRGVDILREAGFPDAASQEVDWIRDRAAGEDEGLRLALGEALASRGYGQSAILLGLAMDDGDRPSRRLLQLLFPFPYRTLITASAEDREIDPTVAAALIRQESLFEAGITSYVGARGLMQLMPATARELAADLELETWEPDLLYRPEMNVHLGTHLLARHIEDYDGFLPAVFGAYNAGPHRIERWKEFPSYGDAELFTERIPYSETRNYVKILTRNRAIYQGLYGTDGESRPD